MDATGRPLRVVLIGPESTGKTRLAEDLARDYGVPWCPEYAREYVESGDGPLDYGAVDAIGRGQRAGEDAVVAQAERLGLPLVILDTDLVSTMVYSLHYYGDCPAWIEREAPDRRGDLYLLHHVDVEWVADGQQRAQPERREELFTLFATTLESLGARTTAIRGGWEERRRRAIEGVDRLFAERR
jgi:NadR type nicotinamide-nucleotide adenylyltransferase